MPFPFLPWGAMLAIAVLAGAMTVFGLALRAMDRAFSAGRRAMMPGLVAGLRNWSDGRRVTERPSPPPAPSVAPSAEIVELVDRHIPDADCGGPRPSSSG